MTRATAAGVLAVLLLAGCGKPPLGQVEQAVVTAAKDRGLSDADATRLAKCAAPKLRAKMSAGTLDDIVADGFVGEADADDVKAAEAILTACADDLR